MTKAQELSNDIEQKISSLDPVDAITLALALTMCSEVSDKITFEQKKDILMTGLDTYRAAVMTELFKLLLEGEPSSEKLLNRVNTGGQMSAAAAAKAAKRFFTLTEMLTD